MTKGKKRKSAVYAGTFLTNNGYNGFGLSTTPNLEPATRSTPALTWRCRVVNFAVPTGLNWNEHSDGSAMICEVRDSLEDREVGDHAEREARQNDRLAGPTAIRRR